MKTLAYEVDLSAGGRAVLLFTDLMYPAVEYCNSNSRVLKTFLVQTLDGITIMCFLSRFPASTPLPTIQRRVLLVEIQHWRVHFQWVSDLHGSKNR